MGSPVNPNFISDEEAEAFFGSASERQQELPRQAQAEERASPFASMRTSPGDFPMNMSPEAQEVNERLAPAAGMAGLVAANPIAAAKGLGYGAAGQIVGATAGHGAGSFLETAGYPEGTQDFLRRAGGGVGALVGPFKGPSVWKAIFGGGVKDIPMGRYSTLLRIIRGLRGEGGGAASSEGVSAGVASVADDPLMATSRQMVKDKTFGSIDDALAFLKNMNPEQQAAIARQMGGANVAAGVQEAGLARTLSQSRPPAPAPPPPAPAPAAVPAAPPGPGPTGANFATEPMPEWVRRSGQGRAWLESRGRIPGAMGPDDVAAAQARGYSREGVQEAVSNAGRPRAMGEGTGWRPQGSFEPTPMPGGSPVAQEVVSQVQQWRGVHKLSDGQIINALREQFGIQAPVARQLLAGLP